MHRRTFITTASTTIATASLAGCSGILGGDDGGDDGDNGTDSDGSDNGTDTDGSDGGSDTDGGTGGSGPRATVEAYIDASEDGDSEAMSEAVHPEGTAPDSPSGGAMGNVDVQSIEVTDQGDSEATVVVSFELTAEGESATGETTYDVRTHEGEWKVYAVEGGV